jgi:FkbH-like protein
VRLADRFGDHGLIAVVITEHRGETLEVDTWLMSCRVLKRQVEDLVLNEIVRLARKRDCQRIIGRYVPSPKNQMVSTLFPDLGFAPASSSPEGCAKYVLEAGRFSDRKTAIKLEPPRRLHGSE